MKTGYSLLLGEYINADAINYIDCKNFQITCPYCHEPIFKVLRKFPNSVHYLSHYNKDKAYIEECENRVSKTTKEHMEEHNMISRGQRLEYFLSVLKDEINKERSGNIEKLDELNHKLNHSYAIQFLREGILNIADFKEIKEIHAYFDDYIKDIEEIQGAFYPTEFSIYKQKKIAGDIWLHLLSAKARGNFNFLINHGYLTEISRIEKASEVRDLITYEEKLYSCMVKLIGASKSKAMGIMHFMAQYSVEPPYGIAGSHLIMKMGGGVLHEMLGCLLRLPYFDMLRNFVAKP